jgi:hypothetical protein
MCELHHGKMGCDGIFYRYTNLENVCVAQYRESRKYATDIERYCHGMLAKLVRTHRTSMHPDCCIMFVTYTPKMLLSSLF